MEIRTHGKIDQALCGKPVEISEGYCRVEMETLESMAVDETGLVHGGFVFGMADYAAMLAVNDPFVVLGGADVRFLKPVRVGDLIQAEARVLQTQGRKNSVEISVTCKGQVVFNGSMDCFILDKHVLD